MAVSNGQGLPTTLLYCKGMLDKYLNWELTGTQIHKYAAHKYCQCKDFAKLSLTTAVFRQRDMCKETFRMFNIQMSHQSEFKKEWQKERAIWLLPMTLLVLPILTHWEFLYFCPNIPGVK